MAEMFPKKSLTPIQNSEEIHNEIINEENDIQDLPNAIILISNICPKAFKENYSFNPDAVQHGFAVDNSPFLMNNSDQLGKNNNQPEIKAIIKTLTNSTIKEEPEPPLVNGLDIRIVHPGDDLSKSPIIYNENDDTIDNDTIKTVDNDTANVPCKSLLSKLMQETSDHVKNPFKNYARFNGKGQEGTAPTKKISIFVWADAIRKPKFSTVIDVVILTQNAKVDNVCTLILI